MTESFQPHFPDDGESSSVVFCLELLRVGDPNAQQKLWDRFFPHLVTLARKRLAGSRHPHADEEDVALSVLNSFFGHVSKNRYPDLRGSDSLWRLLSWMTHRKAIDCLRFARRQRRNSLGESAICNPNANPQDRSELGGIASIESDQTPPDLEVLLAEEIRRWMSLLPPQLQVVATRKLDGFSNQEIADTLDCSLATVERRLKMTREIWSANVESPTSTKES